MLMCVYTLLDYTCITMIPLPSYAAIKFSIWALFDLNSENKFKLAFVGSKNNLIVCLILSVLALGYDIVKIFIMEEQRI